MTDTNGKRPTADRANITTIQACWRAEIESSCTYRELAGAESDEHRRSVLLRLAEAEEQHAERWAARLEALGAPVPTAEDSPRTRWRRFLARASGTTATIRRMEAEEVKHAATYAGHQGGDLRDDLESVKILEEIARDERVHASALQKMTGELGPQTTLDFILRRERWHGRGGGWIGDAIYGVNDGLGAVFGIVSGVAGATANDQHFILVSGLAAMLASALSMGSGAYLAVKAEREVHEAEIAHEKRELEEDPEEEVQEMALFYQLQGFSEEQANAMAQRLSENPTQLLRTMAQVELGVSDEKVRNPWVSAASASLSTALGAFIPIIPFFFMRGWSALVAAAVVSLLAHFAVGAAKTIITTRRWWWSGLEMTIVGAVEGAVTYGIGRAFGGVA